jgi:hypothetical protein
MTANLRKCRLFAKCRDSLARDRGGWLGCRDSNLGMGESYPALQIARRPSQLGRWAAMTWLSPSRATTQISLRLSDTCTVGRTQPEPSETHF